MNTHFYILTFKLNFKNWNNLNINLIRNNWFFSHPYLSLFNSFDNKKRTRNCKFKISNLNFVKKKKNSNLNIQIKFLFYQVISWIFKPNRVFWDRKTFEYLFNFFYKFLWTNSIYLSKRKVRIDFFFFCKMNSTFGDNIILGVYWNPTVRILRFLSFMFIWACFHLGLLTSFLVHFIWSKNLTN